MSIKRHTKWDEEIEQLLAIHPEATANEVAQHVIDQLADEYWPGTDYPSTDEVLEKAKEISTYAAAVWACPEY